MDNKIKNVRVEKINGLKYFVFDVIRVNRRKNTYKRIKNLACKIEKCADMDILYISISELVQNITDAINVLECAEDVNIFEYIPQFIYYTVKDEIIDNIYTMVGRQLGFHNIDAYIPVGAALAGAAEEIPAAGPAALEIMNILDNKAAKKEYSNNIYTYTFNNNSKIEFIAAVLDCDNRINIFDGMGGFYKRLEGRADILNYINKIEGDQKPAAQDLEALKWDYENSINYIIEDINGRALSGDRANKIYFNILKDAEILHVYHGEKITYIENGYINIMNYINTFIADNFTPCGGCGATGEHWDGGACNMCAGTGLKLR